jgi:segregation and condensation protein B
MPSAAKKLAIVHNDEPAPDRQPSQELSNETAEAVAADEIVEITVEEIVEVTDAGQESAQRPEALRLLEAMLFAAADPLDEATLKRALPDGVDVKFSLGLLQAEYATRGVNLVRVGKKWTFRTAGDLSWLLTKQTVETRKLSRAAIETMAIVAYHQPVTRAEIEEIRGVQTATGTLDVLLKTGWIRPRGRRKAPGRPITYGTTEDFLSHFGLEEVGDLPGLDELKGAGLLEGNMPDGFGVPMPSDDSSLRDDEEPLEPGDLELDLGLAPPEAQAEQTEPSEQGGEPEKSEK